MYALLVIIFLIVALLLIVSILMQNSKGTGLAGAFGGMGGASAVFGGRGAATFLSKATTYLAIAFFVLTILINLTVRSRGNVKSVVKEQAAQRMVTPSSALPAPEGVEIDRPVVQPTEENSTDKK